jgi:hypothetical protein
LLLVGQLLAYLPGVSGSGMQVFDPTVEEVLRQLGALLLGFDGPISGRPEGLREGVGELLGRFVYHLLLC